MGAAGFPGGGSCGAADSFPGGGSAGGVASSPGAATGFLLLLVRLYRSLRAGRPSPCRFVPSCSAYATQALERHGAVRGSWLSVRRLARCRPLGGWGADPVPE